MRKGFSFDEAILMTTLSKYAYEVFQHDDGSVDDEELKIISKALYRNEGWQLVHAIRNDDTNVRALILKNTQSPVPNQYALAFRGSIISDRGALEITDIGNDLDWELVRYGDLSIQRAKVVRGFHLAFESVADELQFFFKTLRGELKSTDFRRLRQLPSLRKFAAITAISDAGGIRLGANFEQKVQELTRQVLADGEVDNDEELEALVVFLEEQFSSPLPPLSEPIEVWVTGHSLGGSLCQLGALSLRRWFGSAKSGGLLIKVYTAGAPKIGNSTFIDFYNEQIGEELSYRVENGLDVCPQVPFDPPFFISAFAPEGFRLGNLFVGKYANGGEAITVFGIGSQSATLSFGGIFEIPASIPFPHSTETYIHLLKEQKQFWYQLIRPVKDIFRPFLIDILKDEEIRGLKVDQEISGLNGHEAADSINHDAKI